MLIMINGEKIQKWSMFENMTLYIENVQNAEKILGLLEVTWIRFRLIMPSTNSSFQLWAKDAASIW